MRMKRPPCSSPRRGDEDNISFLLGFLVIAVTLVLTDLALASEFEGDLLRRTTRSWSTPPTARSSGPDPALSAWAGPGGSSRSADLYGAAP